MMVSPYHLSLWEVAHRWHNKHPNETDPGVIPIDVLDTLRWIAEVAIRHEVHLCNKNGIESMNVNDVVEYEDYRMPDDKEYTEHEKWEAYSGHRENISRRHEQLIVGFEFCPLKRDCPKEVFDNVYITRHSLQKLCDQHDVEAPSFWPYDRAESKEESTEKKQRPSTQDKVTVQAVAKTLWDIDPNLTIAALMRHKSILVYAGGKNYSPDKTLRKWLSEVDPREKSQKIGRPKKEINQ